jgi:hypothetical protein
LKILNARINWVVDYDNDAFLEVLVDKLPDEKSVPMRKIAHPDDLTCDLYWGELDGYVRFFFHDPNNARGFAGHNFDMHMEDGSVVSIHGPWSSRAGAMNRHFPHSVDVSITDEPGAFEKGYTFYSGHITIEKAREALAMAYPMGGCGKKLSVWRECDCLEAHAIHTKGFKICPGWNGKFKLENEAGTDFTAMPLADAQRTILTSVSDLTYRLAKIRIRSHK